MEWIDARLQLPPIDTIVLGCCADDVFECKHYEDGEFGDCIGEPIFVSYWMPMPESPYQTGQVKPTT